MHILENDGWYRRKWNIPNAQEWCEVRFLGPWIWFLQDVWIKGRSTRTAERYNDLHVDCFCGVDVRKETSICQKQCGNVLAETLCCVIRMELHRNGVGSRQIRGYRDVKAYSPRWDISKWESLVAERGMPSLSLSIR